MKYDKLYKRGTMCQFREYIETIKRAKALAKKNDLSFSQLCRRGLKMAMTELEQSK